MPDPWTGQSRRYCKFDSRQRRIGAQRLVEFGGLAPWPSACGGCSGFRGLRRLRLGRGGAGSGAGGGRGAAAGAGAAASDCSTRCLPRSMPHWSLARCFPSQRLAPRLATAFCEAHVRIRVLRLEDLVEHALVERRIALRARVTHRVSVAGRGGALPCVFSSRLVEELLGLVELRHVASRVVRGEGHERPCSARPTGRGPTARSSNRNADVELGDEPRTLVVVARHEARRARARPRPSRAGTARLPCG